MGKIWVMPQTSCWMSAWLQSLFYRIFMKGELAGSLLMSGKVAVRSLQCTEVVLFQSLLIKRGKVSVISRKEQLVEVRENLNISWNLLLLLATGFMPVPHTVPESSTVSLVLQFVLTSLWILNSKLRPSLTWGGNWLKIIVTEYRWGEWVKLGAMGQYRTGILY